MPKQVPGSPRGGRGFSIVELMVTVAAAAILAAIALPSFRELGIRMAVSETTNDLVGALNVARAEAVKRGLAVAVIADSGGVDWSSGWTVRADTARDGSFATSLQQHAAVAANYAVHAQATGAAATDDRAVFTAVGGLADATSVDINVCRPSTNPGNAQSRRITIAGSGLIVSHRDTAKSPVGDC